MPDPEEIQNYLHSRIPLSRAMGVEIEQIGPEEFVITAPLAPNANHLGTAFGGSLAAITTLAGYGMAWLLLGDPASHIVIRDSAIRYRRPVRGAIRAVCQAPAAAGREKFLSAFRKKGRGCIRLQVTIREAGQTCVEFEGTFVAVS